MKGNARKRPARADTPDEVSRLRNLLADAQATLRAIRNGDVDAVVVDGKLGPRVYTLEGAEFDYRILIESMNEGALVLTRGALILYANTHFARMVERPLAQIIGCSLCDFLNAADSIALRRFLKRSGKDGATKEVLLQRPPGAPLPTRVSIRRFPNSNAKNVSIGMVVSDLTEFRQREDLLRTFSHGLMRLQETERTQVSTDLGENISQLLCCTLMRCQVLAGRLPANENGFREEVLEFAELMRTTADQVNRIVSELRPHGLEILGLDQALRGLIAESAERMDLPIKVSCATMTERLPSSVELTLYRVLQEALRNVERHADARHVAVTLRRNGQHVELRIKDDGIGFEANSHPVQGIRAGRLGVPSMREQAKAAGGSLKVKSTSSAGTEIRLSVPLSPKPATGQ